MGKVLNNQAAELEADKIAMQFVNSHDVVKDMSAAYNADFSNIKIHTDSSADAKVKAVDRDAIASGTDIFFGKGILESNQPASKGLLAHELAHTMQQGVVSSDGAVSETVSAGAEQGGKITDWFKRLFSSTARRRSEIENLDIQFAGEEHIEKITPLLSKYEDLFPKSDENHTTDSNSTGDKSEPEKISSADIPEVEKPAYFRKPNGKKSEALKKARKKAKSSSLAMQKNSRMQEFDEFGLFDVETGARIATREARWLWGNNDKNNQGKKIISERIAKGREDNFTYGGDIYVNYMDSLQNEDLDFLDMEQRVYPKTFGDESYEYGEALSGMTGDMLDLINANIGSVRGRNYVASAYTNLSDADIFNKDKGNENLGDFIFQDIFTGEVDRIDKAVTAGANKRTSKKSQMQAKLNMMSRISNTLKALPKLAQYTKEQKATLPMELQMLCMKYDGLRKQIDDILEGI